MVALRTCVFVCASTQQLPSKKKFIKMVLVKSSTIQSMFLIVLRRECLPILYIGQ